MCSRRSKYLAGSDCDTAKSVFSPSGGIGTAFPEKTPVLGGHTCCSRALRLSVSSHSSSENFDSARMLVRTGDLRRHTFLPLHENQYPVQSISRLSREEEDSQALHHLNGHRCCSLSRSREFGLGLVILRLEFWTSHFVGLVPCPRILSPRRVCPLAPPGKHPAGHLGYQLLGISYGQRALPISRDRLVCRRSEREACGSTLW